MKKLAALAVLVPALSLVAMPRHKGPAIERAPTPEAMTKAKTIYLLNGQDSSRFLGEKGSQEAFNALYTYIKDWGQYTIVDSPPKADIVLTLRWHPYERDMGSAGSYNTYTKTVSSSEVYSRDGEFSITVTDAKTGQRIWSASDDPHVYQFGSTRKHVDKSIERLVHDMNPGQ